MFGKNRYVDPSDGRKEGELRFDTVVYTKGDKIVKKTSKLQQWNGYYWSDVPANVEFYDKADIID